MRTRRALICLHFLLQACGSAQRHEQTTQSEQAVPIRSSFVRTSDGAKLFVREFGNGSAHRTLLIIPGGPGISHEYLLAMRRVAGNDLRVVFFDPRGVGRSTAPDASGLSSSQMWSLSRQATDIDTIRTSLGLPQLHLVAFSWGALVAMMYANNYGANVSSLVLVAPAAPHICIQAQAMKQFDRNVESLELQGKLPRGTLAQVSGCADALRILEPVYFFDHHKALEHASAPIACNERVSREVWRALGDYDLLPVVNRLKTPLLVVHGSGDPYGNAAVAAFLDNARQAPASVVVLQRCGHRVLQECPDDFSRRLLTFLAEAESRSYHARPSSDIPPIEIPVPECPEDEELTDKLLGPQE